MKSWMLPLPALLVGLLFAACTTDSTEDVEQSENDAALISEYAGAYVVDSVESGTHARQTLTIGADGSIDFDTGIAYAPAEYLGVYDRLFVTDGYGDGRIQVEISPAGGAPQRRFRLFVDTAAGVLNRVAYYPDAASDAGVVVQVSRAPL